MNRRKRTSRFSDNQNLNQVEKIEVQLFKMINDIEINVDQMTTMIEKCAASFQFFQLFENQKRSLLLIDFINNWLEN